MLVDERATPPTSDSFVEPEPALAPEPEVAPRSRRAVLAAALAGVAGAVAGALGRPEPAAAAAGDNLKLGQQNFAGSAATRLSATSSGGAFWMTQNGSGSGVRGDSTSGHGGVFTTAHQDRYGLYAQQNGPAGTGAAIQAEGDQNIGILASTASQSLLAIRGENTTDGIAIGAVSAGGYGLLAYGGIGVSGQGSAAGAAGVLGLTTSTSAGSSGVAGSDSGGAANTNGVFGQSSSSNGNGVTGKVTSNTTAAYGVWGSGSGVAKGVVGGSDNGIGVQGSSGSGWGVYGSSGSSYAGYFAGPVYGTSFTTTLLVIDMDHPADPGASILSHAAVISNEAATLYSGTVTTDRAGRAEVRLPGWFEALNTDLRYQLTTIGSFARAQVSAELRDGRFSIATDEPNVKVSWQVTGVRADAYARAHALKVERPKSKATTGRYLNPIEHGASREDGIGLEAHTSLEARRRADPGTRVVGLPDRI